MHIYVIHACTVCICHNEVSICNVSKAISHEQMKAGRITTYNSPANHHHHVNISDYLFNDTIINMPSGVVFTYKKPNCTSQKGTNIISMIDCSNENYARANPIQQKNIDFISLIIVITLVASARIIMLYRKTNKQSPNASPTHIPDMGMTIIPNTNPDPHPVNTLNEVGVPGSLLSLDQLPWMECGVAGSSDWGATDYCHQGCSLLIITW